MNYKTIKLLLTGNIADECYAYLQFACQQSNKLYNSVLFAIRQTHFSQSNLNHYFDRDDQYRCRFKLTKLKVSYARLCKDFKANIHYQAIGGSQGQQTIKSCVEAIKAYNQLLPMWFKGELDFKPKLPNYRKNGLYQLCFTGQNLKFSNDGKCCFLSIPQNTKRTFN